LPSVYWRRRSWLGVVPLTSAYAACEAFGWETGVDWRWRERQPSTPDDLLHRERGAVRRLVPYSGLVQVMFTAQVVNCLLLPFCSCS